MKTFRLKRLRVLLEEKGELKHQPVHIKDGLIINKEEKTGTWLIEAMIDKKFEDWFKMWEKSQDERVLEVIITHENNAPAMMIGKMREITALSSGISILIDAHMAVEKDEVLNNLLAGFIDDGYSGKRLLEKFKEAKSDTGCLSERIARQFYPALNDQDE